MEIEVEKQYDNSWSEWYSSNSKFYNEIYSLPLDKNFVKKEIVGLEIEIYRCTIEMKGDDLW